MSRRARHPGRRGLHRVGGAPRLAVSTEPAAALRALVEQGIVAAAALQARDDLELAAASTQRLGALSSGMWRALSRELATAAERLDRTNSDRLDDIERRARSLQIDAGQVMTVGVAAAHLAEHRDRLETLVPAGHEAHPLLGPDMLLAFDLEDPEEDHDHDLEDSPGLRALDVSLFFWPLPISPAKVSIVPSLLPGGDIAVLEARDVALGLELAAPPMLLEALATATELSTDDVTAAVSALAVACWSAHHLDEFSQEQEDELTDDDISGDRGPAGGDGG